MKIKNINKILTVILLISLAFNLVSCGNNGVGHTETPTASPTNTGDGQPLEINADIPVNRYDVFKTPRKGSNHNKALVLATGPLEGAFSPFFASTEYDAQVTSMTQLPLITYDKDGIPTAGIDANCLSYDYISEINTNYSTSTHTFVLKNGISFSNGEPITSKDVLFSIYVLCHPEYDGSSDFYTLQIKGLDEYRLQTNEQNLKRANAILKAGIKTGADNSLVINAAKDITSTEQMAFWNYLDEAGQAFCQTIIDYVNNNYAKYISKFFTPYTVEQVSQSSNLQTAFAMVMWKYGSVDQQGIFKDNTGKIYDFARDKVDAKVFWDNIVDMHGYDLGDNGINSERANNITIQEFIKSAYLNAEGKVYGGVQNINGITSGEMVCDDGIEREYVRIILNGIDPNAIYRMGVSVAPFHYYIDGYTGALNDNGVDPDNIKFINFLKTKNDKPLGAGPYILKDYKDNIVTYTANDYFLLGSPKIKSLNYREVALGEELEAVKSGTVHYSNPPASMTIVNDINKKEANYAKLGYALADNNGYGYIGIQGQSIPELNVRRAIAHAINAQLAVDNHYQELASVNYRNMSKAIWAYPDNAENLFPYDETAETSKALFLDAGYKYDEDKKIMTYPDSHEKWGEQVTFNFFLPTKDASTHPANLVFEDTKSVLAKIGVKVNIQADDSLLNKLITAYDSKIEVWASSWGNIGLDPDMFQTWYSDINVNHSASPSTFGLYYLYDNGSLKEKDMLTELNDLILEGRTELDKQERKAIYKRALDLSIGLAVELPIFQRKNIYVYNSEVINESSLLGNGQISAFQTPVRHIWNVELN